MCEHDVHTKESMIRKENETWWKCTKCGSSRNYKAKNPPIVRTFEYECYNCGVQTFNWCKDWGFEDSKGWDRYECSKCKVNMSLPVDEKARKKYREWQKKGCPPPWWFRPTQFLVLLTIIVLSYMFPWVMLTLFLVGTYGLMGYMLVSGELIPTGGWPAYIFSFLFAPILVPLLIVFFALRAPIL
jgi:hypothetical protein